MTMTMTKTMLVVMMIPGILEQHQASLQLPSLRLMLNCSARPPAFQIIKIIFFNVSATCVSFNYSNYHFVLQFIIFFQFIHLQDPLPSRPLPLPAAQAEPQGSLSSGPWGGPWPSPSWAPPSLWPPRPSSPQSLGIPITHQPHPSPPHCSETDQECESSEKEMFG